MFTMKHDPCYSCQTKMQKIFEENVEKIKKNLTPLSSQERYALLIEMGSKLPLYPNEKKSPEYRIEGCQSTLYLFSQVMEKKIFFYAFSDSLISAGLAALLIDTYKNVYPEVILTSPPHYLQELGILSSLSLNRSNGLAQIYLRMKRDALAVLKIR